MHSATPGHDDAVTAERDLRHDIGALCVLRPHLSDLLIQRKRFGDRLQRGEGDRHAGFAA